MQVLLLAAAAAVQPGYYRWPAAGFRRGLHATADGYLHHVSAGSEDAGECLMMLHGNPRSADEFREVMLSQVCEGRLCIAVDFFGAGHSDDSLRPLVPFSDYARYLRDLVRDRFGRRKCDLFGSLTGATLALVVATEYPDMVDNLSLYGLIYYLESAVKTVEHYRDVAKAFVPAVNGSHLVDAWRQRSYSVLDRSNVWLQERTKTDYIQLLPKQWSIVQANLDHARYDTGDMIERASKTQARTLLMYGGEMVREWDQCPPCFNMTGANEILFGSFSSPTVREIPGADEAALNENASFIVDVVAGWLQR